MTTPSGATYSFLPWLRRGIAGRINSADLDPAVRTRASVRVELTLAGTSLGGAASIEQTIERNLQLFGPGDIVGIDRRAIVRVEPRDWITNFEPNYLAAIEFHDADFPWRYTPAAPAAMRLTLRPWIMLVVLTEDEFEPGRNVAGHPLPFIQVPNAAVFPPADQLWAWAHVHVNGSLAANDNEFASSNMATVLPRLARLLDANSSVAYSRIVCPRRLAPNVAYHAFLLPVFERGRLAGLQEDPNGAPHATFSAWQAYDGRRMPTSYPVYHRWSFHTGAQGDFEYLVRLLRRTAVDPHVGTRKMDVLHPGSSLPAIDDDALAGVLWLGGALRVPQADLDATQRAESDRYDNWFAPYPHPFQEALARFVNLADDYTRQMPAAANAATRLPVIAEDPDPLVTAPLYGRWHALTQRLHLGRDGQPVPNDGNWVHQLNLDPRYRVAAALGTRVVQQNQEQYMREAWEQIGNVIEANRRIRAGQLAREVASRWYDGTLQPTLAASPERALALTAPAHRHALAQDATLYHRRAQSLVHPSLTSVAMRRIARPRGRLLRTLPFDDVHPPNELLARVNDGTVTVAPPRRTPPGITTVDRLASKFEPTDAPAAVLALLRRFPWLRFAPLVLAILLVVAMLMVQPDALPLAVAAALVGALVYAYTVLTRWQRATALAATLREEAQRPSTVDALPKSPNFIISRDGTFQPTFGDTDSPQGLRFKQALRDTYTLRSATVAASVRPPVARLEMQAMARTAVEALNPAVAIPRRVASGIELPTRITDDRGDAFREVLAYPVVDRAMYQPLAAISAELFLPSLNLIPPNSVTILETNQAFVEAYMVGLNHEFARELLWREYPTDQRGSYFRQFWEVRGYLAADQNEATLRERLRDIPPLHLWPPASALGTHDYRAQSGTRTAEVVLVIRGELLKKYPSAVIYAHAAAWQRRDGAIDPSVERRLVDITPDEEAAPPRDKLRTPLYEAKVEPDIYFLGFDLSVAEALGGTGEAPRDRPGWFFVIRERPGEPRFGFHESRTGPIKTVNDLSWDDALPDGAPGAYVHASRLADLQLDPLDANDADKQAQHDDDEKVIAAPVSGARWAYLLYQPPVMVAMHAAELLRR
jgi:hypothetical protein